MQNESEFRGATTGSAMAGQAPARVEVAAAPEKDRRVAQQRTGAPDTREDKTERRVADRRVAGTEAAAVPIPLHQGNAHLVIGGDPATRSENRRGQMLRRSRVEPTNFAERRFGVFDRRVKAQTTSAPQPSPDDFAHGLKDGAAADGEVGDRTVEDLEVNEKPGSGDGGFQAIEDARLRTEAGPNTGRPMVERGPQRRVTSLPVGGKEVPIERRMAFTDRRQGNVVTAPVV